MDEDNQDFKLSLRFKTIQKQGVIVSTNSSIGWGALQVRMHLRHCHQRAGHLWFYS